jgi:hypothetical protein
MRATYGGRRHRLVLAGLGAGLAAAVAGCSSDGGDTPAAAGSPTGGTAASTAASTAAGGGSGGSATAGPTTTAGRPTGSPAASVQPVPTGTPAPTDGSQRTVLNNLPGSAATGTCVAVGSRPDVRSGTMAAGNFVTARKAFTDQAPTKEQPLVSLYMIPGNSKGLTTVTVKLRNVQTGASRSMTSDDRQYAEDWLYFPVRITIPSKGTWEITANAGANTGCFSVTFG